MILLVGCGNPLRRDDGAGPLLVRLVARRARRPDIRPLVCHQLTPEIALHLSAPDVTCVLFADASVAGAGPRLVSLVEDRIPPPLGHHLSPTSLLALSARLYGRRPPAYLVTVPGEDFGFGRGVSRKARAALRGAAEDVLRHLAACR